MSASRLGGTGLSRRHDGATHRRLALAAALALASLAAVLALLLLASMASAAAITEEDELGRFGSEGTGAGQLYFPRFSAADPSTGHLYVLNGGDRRVEEFTPWGGFVKAFGWDVAPGAVNEVQEVRVRAAAGTFTLSFEGQTTGDLPFDASASEVEGALDGLSTIGGAGGSVSVEALPGDVATETPYVFVVVFKDALAGRDVPRLAVANGATPLSGGSPKTELEARTRADGTPGGTGLESCTAESGCRAGTNGNGAGQFIGQSSIAVDGAGEVYVAEHEDDALTPYRVQKFSPEGRFIWMVGGEVDKTTGANLCTAASENVCGAAVEGSAPGEFESDTFSIHIAIAPDGSLLAAAGKRIQRFSAAGAYQSQLTFAEGVTQLAVDPASGDLYVAFEHQEHVHKLDPTTGTEIGTLTVKATLGLVTDPSGDIFGIAAAARGGDEECYQSFLCETGPYERIIEDNSSGERMSAFGEAEPIPNSPRSGARYPIRGLGVSALGDVYVTYAESSLEEGAFVRFFGPPPVYFEAAPLRAPQVVAQSAASAGFGDARVQALIDPEFWSDTSFRVEYGTAPCNEGGCASSGTYRLTGRVTASALEGGPVLLEGLRPGTVYYYRFVAQSTGGGPVYGVAPQAGEASFAQGLEGTFRTYAQPLGEPCPANEAFRTGPAALLPDCRAFEMVTPVEKENGDVVRGPVGMDESALSGDRLAYGTRRAFAGAQASPIEPEYIAARREGEGWVTHPVSPPRSKEPEGLAVNWAPEFEAFSPDLCHAWLDVFVEPTLSPAAPAGYRDTYRATDAECGGPAYEPLNTVKPPKAEGQDIQIHLRGLSSDEKAVVFASPGALAAGAPTLVGLPHRPQLYYASEGVVRFVCFLPDGKPFVGQCGTGLEDGEFFNLASGSNPLSADGSIVYWTALGNTGGSPPSPIYVRERPGQPQSAVSGGVCTQPSRACTLPVSEAVEAQSGVEGSTFVAAAADGSKALFLNGNQTTGGAGLYEYRLGDGSTHQVAAKVAGVMGFSQDASRGYLVSNEAYGGENAEGESAVAGRLNLYFWEEGAGLRYVGALDRADVAAAFSFALDPLYRTSRVSADGEHAIFESFAPLTGYDNSDAASGEPDSEVFVYDAADDGGRLFCVSCDPSGARPHGQRFYGSVTRKWTAAEIVPFENQFYGPRVLSEDGRRAFFDSLDALTPRDTNGVMDVYEWEMPGEGGCGEASSSYSPQDGGCVSPISTGKSPSNSLLVDASPSADDVFFSTESSLVPQDYGLVDIYDARVDGGLPPPPVPPPSCEGEACQAPVSPPPFATPGSLSFEGAGDLVVSPPNAVKGKAKPSGRARVLAAALRACRHKRKKSVRVSCERRARKRYARAAGRQHHQDRRHGQGGSHR